MNRAHTIQDMTVQSTGEMELNHTRVTLSGTLIEQSGRSLFFLRQSGYREWLRVC